MITDKQVKQAVNQFEASLLPLEKVELKRIKRAKRYMSKSRSKSIKSLCPKLCKILNIKNNEYTHYLIIEISLTAQVLLSTQIKTLTDFRSGKYFSG